MEKKIRLLKILYFLGIFLAIFIFFTRIHPLVIFDTDDWNYISCKRHPIPLWGIWNPTRVFPEAFMSLCGDIAAFIIYPITGNYINSFTIVNGAAVSAFIVLYLYMFFKLLHHKLQTPVYQTFIMTTIFLLLHFVVFMSKQQGNEYLFWAPDVTCYYYYAIPALLNGSLVMYLMYNDVLEDGWRKITSNSFTHHIIRNGILLLAFYMALFSNLFSCVILAAFIGSRLLLELVALVRTRGSFKAYMKSNILRIVFITAWLVEHIFEVNGGRAQSPVLGISHAGTVLDTLKNAFVRICSMNKLFLLGSFVLIILSIAVYVFNRVRGDSFKCDVWGGDLPVSIIISGILSFVYLILLCTFAGKIERTDVWLGILFFPFLMLVLCGLYVLKKIRWLNILLPLVCCFIIVESRTASRTFADPRYWFRQGLSCSDVINIDNDVISQFIEADRGGLKEMTLYVPDLQTSDNFPLAVYGGNSISRTLYKHGIIDYPVTVIQTMPTREKNEQLNLD